jgi:hypothetical protein
MTTFRQDLTTVLRPLVIVLLNDASNIFPADHADNADSITKRTGLYLRYLRDLRAKLG